MKKSSKVLLFILLIFVSIIIYFSSKEVKQEHIINAHKIMDSIENIYLDVNKTKYKIKKSLEKTFDFNTSDINIKSSILTIESEEIFEVTDDDLKSFEDEALYNFTKEFPDDIEYFKANFEPIFDKKIGSEINLIISNEEYIGYVKENTSDKFNNLGIKNTDVEWFNIQILPEKDSEYKNNAQIYLSGFKEKNGNFRYNGNLLYSDINGIRSKSFAINNNLGVLYDFNEFQKYVTSHIADCKDEEYSEKNIKKIYDKK